MRGKQVERYSFVCIEDWKDAGNKTCWYWDRKENKYISTVKTSGLYQNGELIAEKIWVGKMGKVDKSKVDKEGEIDCLLLKVGNLVIEAWDEGYSVKEIAYCVGITQKRIRDMLNCNL